MFALSCFEGLHFNGGEQRALGDIPCLSLPPSSFLCLSPASPFLLPPFSTSPCLSLSPSSASLLPLPSPSPRPASPFRLPLPLPYLSPTSPSLHPSASLHPSLPLQSSPSPSPS